MVTFASESAGTGRIAKVIGDQFEVVGIQAEVLPVGDEPDPAFFSAIVIGCDADHRKSGREALRFAREHMHAFEGRPIWLFSVSGRAPGSEKAEASALRAHSRHASLLSPRGHKVFNCRVRETASISQSEEEGCVSAFEEVKEWVKEIAPEIRITPRMSGFNSLLR